MSHSGPALQFPRTRKHDRRMSWDRLLCQSRLYPKTPNHSHSRTAFEVDYDRVVFSKPFRRLARKTQVHPLATNDHTHNRLTHSLEVASVGRSMGKAAYYIAQDQEKATIAANAEDFSQVVQAACLAHDVGNTPFGHAGERAIRHWMSTQHARLLSEFSAAQSYDLTLYEGNAQAFRLTTRTVSEFASKENKNEGGMALTAATLATMIKYPWHSDNSKAQSEGKYSVFQSDLAAFEWVMKTTGLLAIDNAHCRHPLTFLVEAADDICNAVIDIEDAIDLRILRTNDVVKSLQTLSQLDQGTAVSHMRATAIATMINACLDVFHDQYEPIMHGEHTTPLIEHIQPELYSAFAELNLIAQRQVYPFQKNEGMEKACNDTIARLLEGTTLGESFISKLTNDEVTAPLINFHSSALSTSGASSSSNEQYEQLMRIMDFVAGMTDNYAVNLAARLSA